MPIYVLPSLNLTCNVWRYNLNPITAPVSLTLQCALVYGKRSLTVTPQPSALPNAFNAQTTSALTMDLVLSAFSDIRGRENSIGQDCVEVPQGTGRYYHVLQVDDIGKGWPNEHRFAKITPVLGSWVAPYP